MNFEKETCSRCHGSGTHSYCQSYGTTCFKCRGTKMTYTKRGEAAKNFFLDLCKVPATEVQVGQMIVESGNKVKIISIRESMQHGASLINGEMVPYSTEILILETAKISLHVSKNSRVLVVQTNNDNLLKALDYQATLTKVGKPRKITMKKTEETQNA